MASVAFLRGVNVGRHKRFQPAAIARELAAFDVVNVGAAGTFVVRRPVAQAKLRAELLRQLAFDAELMLCAGSTLLELARSARFPASAADKGANRFFSVLAARPRSLPRLPLVRPEGDAWQVKLVAIDGCLVTSLHRRQGKTLLYPNAVVEKVLGVAATTRNWNTLTTVCELLGG